MFPVFTNNNKIDARAMEAVPVSELPESHCWIGRTNISHIIFGDFCVTMIFALGLPSFLNFIAHVLYLSSLKKMVRIYACRGIASMQDAFRRPGSGGNIERDFMGAYSARAVLATNGQSSISRGFRNFICPSPTIAPRSKSGSFIDLVPKALNILVGKHRWDYICFSHLKSTFQSWLEAMSCLSSSRPRCVHCNTETEVCDQSL